MGIFEGPSVKSTYTPKRREKKLMKKGDDAIARIVSLKQDNLRDHMDRQETWSVGPLVGGVNTIQLRFGLVIEEGPHAGTELKIRTVRKTDSMSIITEGTKIAIKVDPKNPTTGAVDWEATEKLIGSGDGGRQYADGVSEGMQQSVDALLSQPTSASDALDAMKAIKNIKGEASKMAEDVQAEHRARMAEAGIDMDQAMADAMKQAEAEGYNVNPGIASSLGSGVKGMFRSGKRHANAAIPQPDSADALSALERAHKDGLVTDEIYEQQRKMLGG